MIHRRFTFVLLIGLLIGLVFVAAESPVIPITDISFDLPYDNTTNGTVMPTFISGSPFLFDIELEISDTLSTDLSLTFDLDGITTSVLLTHLLMIQNITYDTSGGTVTPSLPTTTGNFPFNDSGSQLFYLRVDTATDTLSSLDFTIAGFGTPSPTLPSLDIGDDGIIEWQYFGNFLGFESAYTLPATLTEQADSSIAILDEPAASRTYYCMDMAFPYTRDVELTAQFNDSGVGADMEATILQLETFSCLTSATSCKAVGGQYSCSLTSSTTDAFVEVSCPMQLGYALEGNFLACLSNVADGDGTTTQAELQVEEGGPTSAFICSEAGDKYDCTAYTNDDFFIKVKGGTYTETLENTNANFMSGLVNTYQAFIDNVNTEIKNCLPVAQGGCIVPVRLSSDTGGVVSLQNMALEYTTSGVTKTKNDFYMALTGSEGIIHTIDDISLTGLSDNVVLPLTTEGFSFYAPLETATTEYNLTLSLSTGSSDSTEVIIVPNLALGGNQTLNITSAQALITEYKLFLQNQQQNYGDILQHFNFASPVSSALASLNSYAATANSLAATNATAMSAFTNTLSSDLDAVMQTVPSSIVVQGDLTDHIIPTVSDIHDGIVAGGAEAQTAAYHHQASFKVTGRARYIIITLFDGTIIKGTLIEKTIAGQGSNYYVYEIVPKAVVANPTTEASFETGFTLLTPVTNVALFRTDVTSVGGTTFTYFVQDNVAPALNELKTILIPKSGVVTSNYETVPVCGDNKCAVLEVDGVKFYLEDENTCPEDCAKKVDWTSIGIVFLIGVLLIVGIGLYFKFMKKRNGTKPVTKGTTEKKPLFATPKDEKALRDYVTKALATGTQAQKVKDILLKQGWTQLQINAVFTPKKPVKKIPAKKTP